MFYVVFFLDLLKQHPCVLLLGESDKKTLNSSVLENIVHFAEVSEI